MAKEQKLLIDWPTGEFVAGLDEVGRGCGAGPVVTAAVIMPRGFTSPLIRDSKKLSEKQREEAYKIIEKNAIAISCHAGAVADIDALGIDTATFKTMHKCLDELTQRPDYLLIDGNSWQQYKGTNGDNNALTLIPKGDDTYTCIAAAAIIAKVRRDEYMKKLHELHPEYNWAGNKGYLTPDHIAALKEHGRNKYHRTLFIKNFVK
jgi:ribonuclease HII